MENNQISIQQLDENDAEQIMYLESRCFGLITEPNSLYFRITPAILYMHSYKAIVDNDIIGAIMAYDTRDNGIYICSLFVHPKCRKNGIASRLLEKIIQISNNKKITLHTQTINPNAVQLYTKFGFVIVKTFPAYYDDGSDKVVLVKQKSHPQKGQRVHIVQEKFKGKIIQIVDWAENIFEQSLVFENFVYGRVDRYGETVKQTDLGEIVNVGDSSSHIMLQCHNTSCQKHEEYYIEYLTSIPNNTDKESRQSENKDE